MSKRPRPRRSFPIAAAASAVTAALFVAVYSRDLIAVLP
jgi:hypothetical protein